MAQHGTAGVARNGDPARPRIFASRQGRARPNRASTGFHTPTADRKTHVTMVHRTLIDNHCRLTFKPQAKINRQPSRLEFTVSHTKQTPAPQFNRHLSAAFVQGLHDAILDGQERILNKAKQRAAGHKSRFTSHESQSGAPGEIRTPDPLVRSLIQTPGLLVPKPDMLLCRRKSGYLCPLQCQP